MTSRPLCQALPKVAQGLPRQAVSAELPLEPPVSDSESEELEETEMRSGVVQPSSTPELVAARSGV